MSYFAPYIDSSGLHLPLYTDILQYLVAGFKGIFGQDAICDPTVDPDAADSQTLALHSLLVTDTLQALQIIYNNRGPATAIGTALDAIVKLNGMTRNSASYSTCEVILFGDVGASIGPSSNVSDLNGFNWDVTSSPNQPINNQFQSLPDNIIFGTGIAAINPNASYPGENYVVGDVITVNVGTRGSFLVTQIGAGGAVTEILLLNSGVGYDVGTGIGVSGGSGTLLEVDITAIGAVTVTAVCETIGAITATSGQISNLATPQAGWTGVTNPQAAVAGNPVEQDSAFRSRQMISTALPSQTRLAGTIGAIAGLPGVTRYWIAENPTNVVSDGITTVGQSTSGYVILPIGLPQHSLTCVVEGDTDQNVAKAIYDNRGIGCLTYGGASPTTVTVIDQTYGTQIIISFARPTYVPIFVTVVLKALSGYSSSLLGLVQAAITTYLNSLQVYELVTMSGLWGAALSVIPNLARPTFAIESLILGTVIGTQAAADIPMLFYEVAQGITANVVVSLPS